MSGRAMAGMMIFKGKKTLFSRLCGDEAGYLWEIPLLVILTTVVASLVTPLLPAPWNLIPIAVLVLAWVVFLVYNFFFAGWLPGRRKKP